MIVYPSQIPLETDLLNLSRMVMIALGKAFEAMFGAGPVVHGFDCTPGTGLNVAVAAGEIYMQQNVDGTPYGSLAADTAHTIMKQGIQLDPVTLACPAPQTSGQSINYLVEATYQDVDTEAVVLPYFNSSNPSQTYAGPGNDGAAQATQRQGTVAFQVKAGTPAATGTQTTPAADADYVGLWVVTVAFGASTISSGNIVLAGGAPFVTPLTS